MCFSWGRGHPEQYTEAIHLGDERFDSMDSDKKPRAGQILWIRGLTRLQTQVSFFKFLFRYYIFSITSPSDNRKKNIKKKQFLQKKYNIEFFLFNYLTINIISISFISRSSSLCLSL